jgi:putative component of membrane protein insertase Oxa1/YidC/SpoIIIJ protein YidD
MRTYFFCLLIVLGCLLYVPLKAQLPADTGHINHLFDVSTESRAKYHMNRHNGNEFQAFMNLLFIGYKRFVSVQDANRCQFYPSCSQYAWQAVQKKGILLGMLAGFDRLTRCNGMNDENYPVYDANMGLLYDPVK